VRFISAKPACFWQIHFWLPVVLAGFMAFLYPITALDSNLIAAYFDANTHSFLLKHHYVLENIMHTGVKKCLIFITLLVLALWLTSFVAARFKPYRRQLLWTFAAMLLSSAAVSVLKHFSIHGCPYDLLPYGGELPYLPLFASLPDGVAMGKCFPGGHASGGFALMAFYFGFKETHRNFALFMLRAGLLLGFVMGWAQMMRGAHFLSHNIWSGLVVWFMLLAIYLVWPPHNLARTKAHTK
jgi:membrane-associated PAP2 superfamily phosphatase